VVRRRVPEITVEADTCQITADPGTTITAPRTSSIGILRYKAFSYGPEAESGQPPDPRVCRTSTEANPSQIKWG
jgi:hypothetical protein